MLPVGEAGGTDRGPGAFWRQLATERTRPGPEDRLRRVRRCDGVRRAKRTARQISREIGSAYGRFFQAEALLVLVRTDVPDVRWSVSCGRFFGLLPALEAYVRVAPKRAGRL